MGLFGKKKDFWDEVDESSLRESGQQTLSEEEEADIQRELDELEDDGWHPTRSTPLKVVVRILLFISAVVMLVSGYTVYTYFSNGGTMSSEPDYYHSSFFGEEYQKNMVQLLHLVQAIETRGEISETELAQANQDLIKNYMSADSSFSFAVYDADDNEVIVSGEDAVARIEASHYFVKLDTTEGQFNLNTGVKNDAFDEAVWKDEMTSCSGTYTIYAAVDDELTSTTDGFYASYQDFKDLNSVFGIAKIAVFVAAALFLILLIFSIIATGNVSGYPGIKLSLFDKIFTEIAIIITVVLGGGSIYGAWYLLGTTYSFRLIAAGAALALAYIFIIRGYFSLVRRLKAGTFISNMLIYRIFEGIGCLPIVPRILLMVLALVLINGGLVLALFYLDAYELFGIPVVYVLVPIIFVLENICFISWVIRKGNAEYEDDEEEDEDGEEKEEKIPETPYSSNISGDTRPAKDLEEDLAKAAAMAKEAQSSGVSDDWEHMDLGASVDMAIRVGGEEAGVKEEEKDRTMMLPKDEIESLLSGTASLRDSATSFDFIQLNKDIRKLHRAILKENGVAVTLRAPDKPIVLEMNREDMWKAISMIYDNLEQYAEPDSRVYAEMYTQDGKLIYIVKNAVKAEAVEAAKAAAASGAELTGGLKTAKEIVEKNHGKFVVAMDGNIFKTGILLSMVQE